MYSRKALILGRAYEFLEAATPGTPAFSAQAAQRIASNVASQPSLNNPMSKGGNYIPPQSKALMKAPPPTGSNSNTAVANSQELGIKRR
jgi:hypothetical protein